MSELPAKPQRMAIQSVPGGISTARPPSCPLSFFLVASLHLLFTMFECLTSRFFPLGNNLQAILSHDLKELVVGWGNEVPFFNASTLIYARGWVIYNRSRYNALVAIKSKIDDKLVVVYTLVFLLNEYFIELNQIKFFESIFELNLPGRKFLE